MESVDQKHVKNVNLWSSLGPDSVVGAKAKQKSARATKKSASQQSQAVVWGGGRVAPPFHPPQSSTRAHFARRFLLFHPVFLPFLLTTEPGPRLLE